MSRVLIIDSDKYARLRLCRLVQQCECETVAVDTMVAAIAKMNERDFDCVIVDVKPDGEKCGRIIATVRAFCRGAKIIAATSENSRFLESRARRQGVFYYYIKSFDGEELREVMKSALR